MGLTARAVTPIDVALAYLTALGGDEPDAVADLVADGFRNEHQAELGGGCTGRDEYARRLPNFFASFPGRRYDVVEVAVGSLTDTSGEPSGEPTEVVVRYRFTADVDGSRIDIPGVMWISVAAGLVIRRIDTWDSLTYLRQTDQTNLA